MKKAEVIKTGNVNLQNVESGTDPIIKSANDVANEFNRLNARIKQLEDALNVIKNITRHHQSDEIWNIADKALKPTT